MKTFTVKTEYSTYKKCYFVKGEFVADNSLSLEIWNDEDGPIADLTKCLGQAGKGYGFLDMNNCPWAADLVKELGIAEPTDISQRSGYCVYPLYKFDMDKVNEYASEFDD